MDKLYLLSSQARACLICAGKIPFEPKPVFRIHPKSKILVVGQAPGTKVQNTGIPWNDPSGEELRRWLDVGREEFYNEEIFGILPMGFCYPGKGNSGDLPPRPECAPTWHPQFLKELPDLKLILLIGQYAQRYYLNGERKSNLTETVKAFKDYLPQYFPLVHPSPRNRLWQRKNPWFEKQVIPELRQHVFEVMNA
ncbi:uracil-DNA glycosylase family protein [Algoriphagus machipongonensis]|uniref:NLP/P60 family protein n=1 Tax=Algoriphagus machipongonensis TaxID=388413 RepID=A3I1M7_9BACT|nr:uracil-DNA glycosylase family protein [Algoriphagus machipongonensis]EAZ79693.1 NLP/P60 family protein [Algoriphagus machipongonensis]